MASSGLLLSVPRALSRARAAIISIGLVYLASVIAGAVMVHTGNQFALDFADNLVAQAHSDDPSSLALQRGDRIGAALSDFSRNLLVGAVPNTITGLAVVIPYPLVAFRGWVGGIVSVNTDAAHTSRLADWGEAVYYIITLILQLIPYTLAGGAGVNLGMAYLRPRHFYRGDKWLTLPSEAVRDVLRIYVLVVPLFLVASLWEYLMR
jgi:hypothetical protein